ncbi:hypothetical protein [Histidinibacterium aquaticum]|uniref:hypothetical protein n=1 Tax=Histidinibacterium aquaticum TaxID=2613962 RepID=UPI001CC462A2|nr:hypothetical protein [Histidinibacterium aquaticum]
MRLTGALLRAMLVVLLIATPSVLLPGTHPETAQIVALVALLAALFTLIEYNSHYPSLVEFRDAPPFNRLRFCALFACVFFLTVIARGQAVPTTITDFFSVVGVRVGELIDFPYSPVRLVLLMMPADSPDALLQDLRTAAGLSYLISILSLVAFALVMWLAHWPARHGGFNVWVNLPTFDPTAGGDVVDRLQRDAQVNLVLGFLLPFIIPAVVKVTSAILNPISLDNPHTLIWTTTAWAFLPASLFMRGIALHRVAQMIRNQRLRAYAAAKEEGMATA